MIDGPCTEKIYQIFMIVHMQVFSLVLTRHKQNKLTRKVILLTDFGDMNTRHGTVRVSAFS